MNQVNGISEGNEGTEKAHLFGFSGFGYLQNVFQHTVGNETSEKTKVFARIKGIINPNADNTNEDDVWLTCQITHQDLISISYELLEQVRKGLCIIVKFKASYERCNVIYSKRNSQDPENIVDFSGHLISIDDIFTNGLNVKNVKSEVYHA